PRTRPRPNRPEQARLTHTAPQALTRPGGQAPLPHAQLISIFRVRLAPPSSGTGRRQFSGGVDVSWVRAIVRHDRLLLARMWHVHESRWVIVRIGGPLSASALARSASEPA